MPPERTRRARRVPTAAQPSVPKAPAARKGASKSTARAAARAPARRGRATAKSGEARGPGRPRAREADEDKVRERLIEAATELAAEQGFETCGLREIAARAAVSPAMIAYYFRDREGLGEALYQRVFERAGERVRALVESRGLGAGTGVDQLVQLYVATFTADPWLPKLIASELLAHGASPLRSRLFRDLARGPLMRMIRWLEDEQAQGRLRADVDARWLAISIAGLCAFPFLIVPIVGPELGLSLDRRFAEKLVAHTRLVLAQGLRAPSEVFP